MPELIERMERSRAGLEGAIGSLDRGLLMTPGQDGWSVGDHVAHVAAWENSVVALLRGIPRHVGLGVDSSLYAAGSEDDINAAIVEKARSSSFEQALERHREVHEQMLSVLSGLTDADLGRGYTSFLPDEHGEESGRPVIQWIAGNTYEHCDEHGAWIGEPVRHFQAEPS